jgi:hypothetical protein
MQNTYETSNKRFAEVDVAFRRACQRAGIPPTTRQASKYRLEKGSAYLSRFNN